MKLLFSSLRMADKPIIGDSHQLSEVMSRILFDLANDGLFILDLKGHVVDINRTGHDRLGYTKEEMVGQRVSQFNTPEFAKQVPKRFAEIQSQGSAVFESAHVRKNGSVMPIEISARLINFDKEDYIFSVVRDITERKEYERRHIFQSKIYSALYCTNQALLDSTDEINMFDKICRIAVDFGGMAMAWIGREDSQSRLIKVESRYGNGLDYLCDIKISARVDVPEGQGRTSIAYQELRPVISQDILMDSSAKPWHKHAQCFGWQASAAIGIPRGGNCHAVISFYHYEKNAFTEEIVQLLAKMARNIEFCHISSNTLESSRYCDLLRSQAHVSYKSQHWESWNYGFK